MFNRIWEKQTHGQKKQSSSNRETSVYAILRRKDAMRAEIWFIMLVWFSCDLLHSQW